MGFNCGIVGLPNAGKSTLFNALTATAAAQAGAYPFTTIEPHAGRVAVPDPRLARIAQIAKSARIVPTRLDFMDIAGLVRGASRGEGLGNRFLAHIREVDAICHVLRCFEDGGVTHVEGSVDPIRDAEIIETELLLADLDRVERRLEPTAKRARGGEREARILAPLLEQTVAALREGRPARGLTISKEEMPAFRELQLLTAKPVLYVCNVDEAAAATGNVYSEAVKKMADSQGAACVIISAHIESEIVLLKDEGERQEFLASLGLEEAGLARVIAAGYALLDLITFFTAGPTEARAWTVPKDSLAVEAAARIHTDFARGFICAETIAYDDYVAHDGEQGAKEAGKMRAEGRDYLVQDGDVILFRFNV
jgi:GTP-binding protein YchF